MFEFRFVFIGAVTEAFEFVIGAGVLVGE
jgi:hypothetical protein